MILNLLHRKSELISQIDTNRIYVENVRSFFHVPYRVAKLLCEMAVKEGYFRKKTALVCPNDNCKRVIKIQGKLNDDNTIKCENCDANEENKCEFNIDELQKVEFYQLNR